MNKKELKQYIKKEVIKQLNESNKNDYSTDDLIKKSSPFKKYEVLLYYEASNQYSITALNKDDALELALEMAQKDIEKAKNAGCSLDFYESTSGGICPEHRIEESE